MELTTADKIAIRILSKTKSNIEIARFLNVGLYTIEKFKINERILTKSSN